jgi:hypothetical protein
MANEHLFGYSSSTPSSGIDPLPSAFAMLKRSWGIFRKRSGTFFGIAAFSVVPMIIVYVLFATDNWLWVSVATVIMALGQLMMMMAYILAMAGGEAVGANEAYRRASGKLLRAIWLAFIFFVVVFGAAGLLIIPGIIFFGWFMFAFYIMVLEDQGGMNALFYSREYVKGKWWAIVGYMLLPAAISMALTWVFNAVFSALHVPYASEVVNIALSLIVTPVAAIYMYLVYAGLKAKQGPVTVKSGTGRKAKYLAAGSVGLVFLAVFLAGSILLMLTATKGAPTFTDQPTANMNAQIPTVPAPKK